MKKTKSFISTLAIVLALLIGFLATLSPVNAQSQESDGTVIIHLFWGEGCPHCAKAKPYFEQLAQKNPNIVLNMYEIYYDEENLDLFLRMAEKYEMENLGVPTIFIGDFRFQGFNELNTSDYENAVTFCLKNQCEDAAAGVAYEIPSPTQVAATPDVFAEPESSTELSSEPEKTFELTLPIFGKVDLENKSLLLSTALIALVDGVNPCSLWVLTMLLALTLHTGSRKRVFLIGIVFLTVTAGIYALFISGLFSVLKFVGFLTWVRVIISLVALFFAIVNIKDYFWYKEGLSLTIADEKKPGLFQKMRKLTDASQSLWGLVGATIVFAAGVSLVEFSCTAGFPVVWVNLLSAQQAGGTTFLLLLLLYMLIYQLDEMIIFVTSVVTLKSGRLEEKGGRILKLISGMLMLTLSAVMLIKPEWMNNIATSLIVFGVAFLATLLILFLHRYILPKAGVALGTEQSLSSKKRRKK